MTKKETAKFIAQIIWGYVVHELLEKERHPIRVPLLFLEQIIY